MRDIVDEALNSLYKQAVYCCANESEIYDCDENKKTIELILKKQEKIEELLKRYFELNRNPFLLNEDETKEWCALESELKKVSEGK